MSTEFGYDNLSFSWGDHICAVFDHHAQQMAVMTAFIAEGLRSGQRCVWVSPEASARALRDSLAKIGGDLPTLEASSQLIIISEVEFYLEEGMFEPARTLELIATMLRENQREGYPETRMTSDVSWLPRRRLDPDLWLSFESQITQMVSPLPMVMICQHDRRQLSASLIGAALSAHPLVLIGETLYQNPFYQAFRAGVLGPADVV
jgi:hypothetical protein